MMNIKKHLSNELFLLFAFFPLIPNTLKGLPVILLVLGSFFLIEKTKVNWKWFLINSSTFLLYVFSLLYTTNFSYGFKKLETGLTFFIVPLVFFVLRPQIAITSQLRKKFLFLFVLSSTIFASYILFFIISDNNLTSNKDFYSDKFRLVVEKVPLIGQHPIYASIYLGNALIFTFYLFQLYSVSYKTKKGFFLLIAIFINTILLLMLSSKAVIFSLIILLILYFVHAFFLRGRFKKGLMYLCMLFIGALVLFVFNRRVNEMIRLDTYASVNSSYSNSFRVNIYECAINVFKHNPILGVGIGDAQDALNECYSYKSQLLLNNQYNSHNQYLDFCIKLGFLGLVVFIGFLAANYRYAHNSNDELFKVIILFYCLNFLTENILVRQSGLILFVFFIHFFRNNKTYKIS
ncbi:O-antigen ligase [Mangrovimonas sp. YM274]|uniref:O-antigen ligase family protein n=1 Tax=Mangrovimonas sp. YM274 TaxID=3070660 RepID=UPI0027DC2DB2|nr:O-antigen ligase family protein [Mangrovimonas sp. YM274]WMI68927.1 O-antigen ligase family protein [Mangrovimonas sp. YM274]